MVPYSGIILTMSQQASDANNPSSYSFASGVLIQALGAEVLIFDPKSQQTHLVSGELARLVMRISDPEDSVMSLTSEEQSLLGSLLSSGLVDGPSNRDVTLGRRAVLLAGTGLALSIALPTPAAASSSLCAAIGCRSGRNAFRCNCSGGVSGVLCSRRACNDPAVATSHQNFCAIFGQTPTTLECCPC